MKRLLLLLAIIPFFFASCVKDPYADFIASKSLVETGEVVYFTNRSYDSKSYEWDFGDGYSSRNFNTSHFYENPGRYTVRLTAFGKDGRVDVALIDIDVYVLKGSLEITVLEYYDKYPLYDASVRLYPTVTDWENETNMIAEGFTNTQGRVIFTNLDANYRYYADIWEENHDNYKLAAEDVEFIESPVILPDRMNYWTAFVDYYTPGKKSSFADRKSLKDYIKKTHNPVSPRIPMKIPE
jgi:PKD repeat protein